MTDREIIDFIKKDIVEGNTIDFLTLDIVDKATGKRYCFGSENMNDMMAKLFDYSLTSKVGGINALRTRTPSQVGSYNGNPYPVVGYIVSVEESEDHQTNISPMLMKFLEVVMNRTMLDRLAYPMYRNRFEYEFRGYSCGNPIIYIPPEDPWETLEKYMNGEEA